MEQISATLHEVEDWLYDEDEDETKGVYVAKIDELKKQGYPIEVRHNGFRSRETIINQLGYCINSYHDAAMSSDHIDRAKKQKVLNECAKAKAWLREKKHQQDYLPKHVKLVLFYVDVMKKA